MLPVEDSSNALFMVPAVARASSGSTETHEFGKRQEHGSLEVWICTSCGLTEWYSANVNQALAQLSRNPKSGVTYVDGDSPAPYR